MNKCKVLFLSANPAGTGQLQLDEEIREIAQKLRFSDYRDSVDLIPHLAARPDDFLQALLEHTPHVVHFSGHGSTTGELIFLDRDGNPKPVDADSLTWLFRALTDNVRVVLLNACHSEKQATAIADVVDCTIGMTKEIGDAAAIVFAASFYRAVGFGRSVQDAFNVGIAALRLEGISGYETPTIKTRAGIDAARIMLVDNREKPRATSGGELPILILGSYYTDDESKKDHLHYRSRDDAGVLAIEPDDPYLDTISTGGIIWPVYYCWAPWEWRFAFPALDIKLVNNTDQTVYFHEAILRVKNSRMDSTPVPVICGTGYDMTTTLENVGWGPMEKSVLRFSLIGWSDGEELHEPNNYPYEIQLGDIMDEPKNVPLDEFFADTGADLRLLKALYSSKCRDKDWVYFPLESELGTFFNRASQQGEENLRRLPITEYDGLVAKAFGPFPDGVGRLIGRLDYGQADQNGERSRHSVGISARVEIGRPGLGLPGPPSYSYNVRLEVDGSDYQRRVPISQWLAPKTTDRFLLYVGADKSSVHDFDLILRYNESNEIRSRPVHLSLFISRPDSRRVQSRASMITSAEK